MEWYPFYPALYRADTMHLTAEQDGIYRRLIDHYMETRQPLPDNDLALARIASVPAELWQLHSATIRAFFRPSKSGFLHHKRCNTELERQDARNRLQTEKAKNGAKVRWEKYKEKQEDICPEHATSIAQAMPNYARGEERRGEDKIKEVLLDTPRPAKADPKGTRISSDWILTPELEQWAEEHLQSINLSSDEGDIQRQADKFKDYWLAASGAKARKVDWLATWKNWIRTWADGELQRITRQRQIDEERASRWSK
ncbi:Protein of unknown function DUF1376 [uncultured Caudovirales phage]|uniref:Uncharacterized protein n=1 Tax=uncultured Caudovirales phage TaxID=2100421 RepID=A0A6J5P4L4_9CAUD|nr:Protein of unknown function DUF1376 [uncultured Caudovirales phage]